VEGGGGLIVLILCISIFFVFKFGVSTAQGSAPLKKKQ